MRRVMRSGAIMLIAGAVYAAEKNPATDWMAGKIGAFMHFLPNEKNFDAVDAFHVRSLTRQLVAAKVDYFVFTLGQNSGYMNTPNDVYDAIAGYAPGERCAKRDLPKELAAALKPHGIRLMLYLPCQTPNRDLQAIRAFGLPEAPVNGDRKINEAFARQWARVIETWSMRYGRDVAGWWFDGGYQRIGFNDAIARHYAAAVKRGNPDAVVTFNPGVSLKRWTAAEDYTAGELTNPFSYTCKDRWLDGSQWHVLTYLGKTWGSRDCRAPDEKWIEWIRGVIANGGAVTLDVGPFYGTGHEVGSIPLEQTRQLWAIANGCRNPAGKPVPKETLHNGIVLERDPRDRTWMDQPDHNPLPVPYLQNPPAVIPVDLGRQLLVDDFLIETSTLKRVWHKAVKDPRSPVLKPETPLENGAANKHCPMAAPFSGGVWFDAQDRLFKMWYCAGWFDGTAYAFSRDGIRWERPDLKAEPGTNRVIPQRGVRDSAAVILDPDAPQDGMRFKMLVWSRPQGGELFVSRDGLNWSEPVVWGPTGDRSTIFYNPFRKVWVYSIRSGWRARSREYSEATDFLGGAKLENRVRWLRTDDKDLRGARWFYAFPDRRPERPGDAPVLYNFDAVAYESLLLGAFTIMQGPENNFCMEEGVPKMTEIHLGFSRDGFHWSRPEDRTAFLPAGRQAGTWDRAYLHSNAALCLVMGDELWFYYTGFAGDPARKQEKSAARNGMYANASTGIARLRRDGFASLDADEAGGMLTTRPVTFTRASRLYVNADTRRGELRVEVLDADGNPIAGLSRDACARVSVDSTRHAIIWQNEKDLASLRGKPVRFRFHLTSGSLYAFWVSNRSGASNGYLAGGGPGYTSLRDTW
ncbi:MAG: alpha-L-fucosidase [Kiritimatiellia bacterium]|nr:alpha-L-fucosidase [Kiritimatiellia bacterium]